MAETLLITGLMASGKSSVGQAVAERLPRSVHLRGDIFRRMIVNGRAEMGFDLSDEAFAQLRLRYGIAASVAARYREAGFTVVYQDIIVGPILQEVVELHQGAPLAVVVLCPAPEVIARRDAGRGHTGYGPEGRHIADFDRALRLETPRLGLWLDSSALTVDETAEIILARLDEARL